LEALHAECFCYLKVSFLYSESYSLRMIPGIYKCSINVFESQMLCKCVLKVLLNIYTLGHWIYLLLFLALIIPYLETPKLLGFCFIFEIFEEVKVCCTRKCRWQLRWMGCFFLNLWRGDWLFSIETVSCTLLTKWMDWVFFKWLVVCCNKNALATQGGDGYVFHFSLKSLK